MVLNRKSQLTKVPAYVTREKEGEVQYFTMLEKGAEAFSVQIPVGTLKSGGDKEDSILREVSEEAHLGCRLKNLYKLLF